MSSRGKKYNIWIAYSDLFTNLSTFLFISALGVFAAFGSGLLAVPGMGASRPCSMPATVRAQMEAGDSLWKIVGSGVRGGGAQEGCTEYYSISGFQFRSEELSSFTDANHRPPGRDDLQLRICKPVWLTLATGQFKSAEGRITFVGVPQSGSSNEYPASCGALRRDDQWIDGFPRGRESLYVISDCRLRGPQAYRICPRVLQCLEITKPDDRSSWCRSVWAADQRGRQADAACRKAPAEEQAKTLYDQCEGAIDSTFPDQEFERPGMRALARRRDGRSQMWGAETSFDAIPTDALSRILPANHPLAGQPAGSILVKVHYGR